MGTDRFHYTLAQVSSTLTLTRGRTSPPWMQKSSHKMASTTINVVLSINYQRNYSYGDFYRKLLQADVDADWHSNSNVQLIMGFIAEKQKSCSPIQFSSFL